MSPTPPELVAFLSSLPERAIPLGSGGISLLAPEDLAQGQTGYRTGAAGGLLIGQDEGAWQEDWLVIGHETASGDPLFASAVSPHPVMTAMHEEGAWHASPVAPSLEAFGECLSLFREIARGRETPAALAAKPLGPLEAATYIAQIGSLLDGAPAALDFWMVQAEIGLEE